MRMMVSCCKQLLGFGCDVLDGGQVLTLVSPRDEQCKLVLLLLDQYFLVA